MVISLSLSPSHLSLTSDPQTISPSTILSNLLLRRYIRCPACEPCLVLGMSSFDPADWYVPFQLRLVPAAQAAFSVEPCLTPTPAPTLPRSSVPFPSPLYLWELSLLHLEHTVLLVPKTGQFSPVTVYGYFDCCL